MSDGVSDVWRLLQSPLTPEGDVDGRTGQRGHQHEEPMEEETMTDDSTVDPRPSWQEDWTSSDRSGRRERTEPDPEQSPGRDVHPLETLKRDVAQALAVMDKVNMAYRLYWDPKVKIFSLQALNENIISCLNLS